MNKVQWKKYIIDNGMDPIKFKNEFKNEFITQLVESDILNDILNIAVFQTIYHDIQQGCPAATGDDECSYCYSGDTEFEMTHDALNLTNIWKKVIENIKTSSSDAEEEDTDTSYAYNESCDDSNLAKLVDELDDRYGDLKSTSTSSSESSYENI
jgi:hypothetical protein